MYILYKDTSREEDLVEGEARNRQNDHIMVYSIDQGYSGSISDFSEDSVRQYTYPLADTDLYGNLHVLYGSVDTTEYGKSYIRRLNYTSNWGFFVDQIYEMNDSTNKDTVVNFAIATNLVSDGLPFLAIAYQLSNDSIYVMYQSEGSVWKHEPAFPGTEPSISIGCGYYRGNLITYATFPVIQFLDSSRNICEKYIGNNWKKGTWEMSAESVVQQGPVESVCIDDIMGPFGYSYIFQKERTLYHAFSWEYTNEGIRDTVSENVMAASIAYKEFNTDKVDIVWVEEAEGKYELYYQWFEKIPMVIPHSEELETDLPFSVYPNPFKSHITFRIEDDISKVAIYSMEGKILKTFNNFGCSGYCEFSWDGQSDNGEQVSDGMYILQFSNDNEVYTRKIIRIE